MFLVVIGGGASWVTRHQPPPASSATPRVPLPPADRATLELLAPWALGTRIGDYRIVAIHGVADGNIWVLCRKGANVIYLRVNRSGGGPLPPASAPPYAIFVEGRRPSEPEGQVLADRLAAVLRANASQPTPVALQPYNAAGGDVPVAP